MTHNWWLTQVIEIRYINNGFETNESEIWKIFCCMLSRKIFGTQCQDEFRNSSRKTQNLKSPETTKERFEKGLFSLCIAKTIARKKEEPSTDNWYCHEVVSPKISMFQLPVTFETAGPQQFGGTCKYSCRCFQIVELTVFSHWVAPADRI